MAKQILAYECAYCGILKKSRKIAERHERSCFKNPNAVNCMICENRYDYKETLSEDEWGASSRVVHKCKVNDKLCSRSLSGNCTHFEPRHIEVISNVRR